MYTVISILTSVLWSVLCAGLLWDEFADISLARREKKKRYKKKQKHTPFPGEPAD